MSYTSGYRIAWIYTTHYNNYIAKVYTTTTTNVNSNSSCTYKISENGLDFIKKWEGFSPTPYKCSADKLTIGYGHRIKSGENYTSITKSQATQLLCNDLNTTYGTPLNNFLKKYNIVVSQAQYDALLSFTYNCGEGIWSRSEDFTLRKYLREYKDGSKIPDSNIRTGFGNWNKVNGKVSQGLVNRRKAEADMFISGKIY